MATTTYTTNTNTAPGGAQTTVYTPSTAPPGTGMPVPAGGSVDALNASRQAAVDSGQNAYSGNLSSYTSFKASQAPAPVAPAATPATPISASAVMNPPAPLSIPAPPAAPATAAPSAAIAGSAAAGNAAIQSQLDAQTQTDQTAATTSKNTVQSYIDQLLGKGVAQSQMETDAGIPDKTQQLTDITNEYNTKQLAFRQAAENAYAHAGNQASGDAAVAALDRQNNAELADIAVRQSVAQGNLTAAQNLVDHKIALQYGDLKDIIGYQMQFLQTNETNLSNDQKAQLQQKITENQRQYDTETAAAKELETQKLTTLSNAMEMGAPAGVQQAIQAAKTPEDALAAAGKYAGGLAAEAQRANIAQSYASANASNATAAKSQAAAGVAGMSGASPELLAAIDAGTIDPNRINSRTLGIYNDMAKAGVDAAASHAGIAGNTAAYGDVQRYQTTATRVVGVLDKNIPLVAALADKVNQTGVPGLDSYLQGVKQYTGNNPDVIKYVNSIKTLRSEYAQMLAKGNVPTEGDKTDAATAIPSGLSSAGYTALGQQLKLEASNIISTAQDTKAGIFNSSGSGTDGAPAPASAPQQGDTHVYNGVTYVVQKGQWVPQ